ncbi:tetratricopeptide repeat protein [Myxococcota bacterium]|nr:tetratricopeptide repeat protein [Myxococcota bacterium]
MSSPQNAAPSPQTEVPMSSSRKIRVIHHPHHAQKRQTHTFYPTLSPQEPEDSHLSTEERRILESSDLLTRFRIATEMLRTGRFFRSIEAFDYIQQQHPEQAAHTHAQIGAAHFFLHHYEKAIHHYEKALELGANPTMMHANILEARNAQQPYNHHPSNQKEIG